MILKVGKLGQPTLDRWEKWYCEQTFNAVRCWKSLWVIWIDLFSSKLTIIMSVYSMERFKTMRWNTNQMECQVHGTPQLFKFPRLLVYESFLLLGDIHGGPTWIDIWQSRHHGRVEVKAPTMTIVGQGKKEWEMSTKFVFRNFWMQLLEGKKKKKKKKNKK